MITGGEVEQQVCRVEIAGEVGYLYLPEFLTIIEAVAFKKAFQDCCQHNPNLKKAVVDFTGTRFIDSSGIGALVNVWKVSKSHNLEFCLANVASQIMMALSLAGLDSLFEIQALSSLPSLTEPGASVSDGQSGDRPMVTHPSVVSKAKRLIDIIGASVGLVITALIFIPIAIAIKLDDPGPIFFGQIRCSLMGKRFRIWKFRSMVADAEKLKHKINNQFEDGKISKDENDPRITRVGRFLRKTSLDEFPQFWNVLQGDMSLVGTRPPTPDEVEQYDIPEWQRLDVKPGITGEWQVNGRSSIKTFEDIIKLDLRYQERWSLMYDITLIFKTVFVIFDKKSGAM
ncbi:MAG: STAS domain-containing protein [Merismopedia sp. SIO2A8]|nr:STAS domain-containing protein [Merismopedia sp. SIO2A8]